MKRAIITGGAGFLGRAVADFFKKLGFEVYGIGHNEPESGIYIKWINGDVTLVNLLALNIIPDLIVHCASSGSVHFSRVNPNEDFKKTVGSTADILEYVRMSCPGAKLIIPSSAAVYGNVEKKPIPVTHFLNPASTYGIYKKIVEEMCNLYSTVYGLDITIIRFFSLYGDGLKKQLLWDACQKISRGQGEVEFWGTGDEIRDWLHIKDAISLINNVISGHIAGKIINGGSGRGISVREALTMIKNELKPDINLRFNNMTREGDPKYLIADMSGLKFEPQVEFAVGIKQYIKWFQETVK